LDGCKREVEEVKLTFLERYQQFARALKSAELHHTQTIDELKRAYTQETAELVQKVITSSICRWWVELSNWLRWALFV
jgi:hypothetical protein